MARILLATLIMLLISPGCARDDTFRGHFVTAFEVSSFQPCGSNVRWWLTGGDERLRLPHVTPIDAFHIKRYVEVRGHLSPLGSYGHLGRYPRQLQVEDVLVVRAASAVDCRAARVSPN